MDPLLSSLDVSTPTAPLTSPDLRLLLSHLQSHSTRLQSLLHPLLLSHRPDLSLPLPSHLLASLPDALEILSSLPDAPLRDLAVGVAEKSRELREARETLEVVEWVEEVVRRVGEVRGDAREGRFVRAANGVRALEGVGGGGGVRVFEMIEEEVEKCSDELQELLAKLVEKAVQFDSENGVLRVMSQLSIEEVGVYKLKEVIEALDIVGVLDYGYAKLADLLVKHVMKPVISNDRVNITTEHLPKNSEGSPEAVLKIVQPSESPGDEEGLPVYSRLIDIIEFTNKSICYENDKWMFCLGRLTWSRISELVITFYLSKAVPDDASRMGDIEKIIKYTVEFEAFLKKKNFISQSDDMGEKLSRYVRNVEVHFATRRRNGLLATARNLILQCDFVPSLVHGREDDVVDLLFQHEKCVISKAAKQLMEVVHQTLQDVCSSPPKVALELYHAARDALLLYRAIAPVKLGKQLETISQEAIILHNDCTYLSQEISGLAYEYRSNFPVGVKEITIFIDMAPHLRQLAEDIMQKQVDIANSSLTEAIDGANGYQNTHQSQQYELARFSIDKISFSLEKIHILWEPLLPKSTYKRCMCMILNSVFSRLTSDILLLDDIAAEETFQLRELIHLVMGNTSSVVDSIHTEARRSGYTSSLLETLPSLCKLQKLADLLDMPLKTITASWESGELRTCGFSASEVANFIRAIFAESPLRRDCLWKIERSSP